MTSTQGPFGVLSARREPCRPRDLPTEIRRLPRRRAISTPDRNREARGGPTSGGRAIDAAPPTSVASTTARSEETSRAPRERGYLATVFSTVCQAGDRPLTLSVAPRCSGNPEDSRSQRRFRRTLVKRSDIRDAERLPSTSAPWSGFRRAIDGNPPPISRFGHHDSGFRHFFAPCRSRVGGLDPRQHQGLFTHGRRGPRAACRFLQP